jgi:predicted nucleic acid-binding protein
MNRPAQNSPQNDTESDMNHMHSLLEHHAKKAADAADRAIERARTGDPQSLDESLRAIRAAIVAAWYSEHFMPRSNNRRCRHNLTVADAAGVAQFRAMTTTVSYHVYQHLKCGFAIAIPAWADPPDPKRYRYRGHATSAGQWNFQTRRKDKAP